MNLKKLSKYIYIESKSKFTYLIILISSIVFLAEGIYSVLYGEAALNSVFNTFGFSFSNLLEGKYWVSFTSIFFHASSVHLILNMIALFFFGKIVEAELGPKKFLLIFFLSSIVGDLGIAIFSLLGYSSLTIPTIGASAAIFGIMGTAMLIKPFEFVFYPYLIPIPLVLVALLYTLYNIAAFLFVLATGITTEISYVSHIGGLMVGMLFGFQEEGSKKSLRLLLIILALLIIVPLVWFLFQNLELLNYTSLLSQIFK